MTITTKRDSAPAPWRVVASDIALPMLDQIEEMVRKEEKILLPMAVKTLTTEEWGAVHRDSFRFGFCLVEPGSEYHPPAARTDATGSSDGSAIPVGVGHLTSEQLRALVDVLPFDLTFVDADDRVAFYSEGPHRVFARSKTIVGRKVQHCHPPRSVAIVDRILDDFRAGRHEVAEFWIEFHGRFVHIRYFAVRSAEGTYQGCLEVTQDVTAIRALTGERRLLHYDEAQTGGADGAAPSHGRDGGTRSVSSTSGRNGGAR